MTARAASLLLAIAMGVASAALAGQQRDSVLPPIAEAGTASVSGTVTSDATGAPPVRRALVTLSGGGGSIRTLTDDRGAFAFMNLPAWRFTLMAEKAPFVRTYFGSPRIGQGPGASIPVSAGQAVAGVRLTLIRGASIEGTLRDEAGTPLSSGQVRAMRATNVLGERRFVDLTPMQLATTDDRGVFRLYGLPPGEYTVAAAGGGAGVAPVLTQAEFEEAERILRTPGGGGSANSGPRPPRQTFATAMTFYPSVVERSQASTLTLVAGEERTGIDLTSKLVAVSPIAGSIFAPDGRPAPGQNTLVGIANLATGSVYFSPGFVRPDAAGAFRTPAIPAGRYLFYGQLSEAGAPTGWVSEEVHLDEAAVAGVMLQFRIGTPVSGTLRLPEGSRLPDTVRVSLQHVTAIQDAAFRLTPVALSSAGTFSFPSVPPGRYRLSIAGAGAWTPRSAVVGGSDVLDTPLAIPPSASAIDIDVAMTDRPATLTGRLTDQLGRPAPDYAVVVFPADESLRVSAPRRASGIVRLGTDARFTITSLPPGEYFLAAITDLDPAQLSDQSLLQAMSAVAVRVTLVEGASTEQNIQLGGF